MRRREWIVTFGGLVTACGPKLVPVEQTEAQPRKIHVARPKAAVTLEPAEEDKRDGFADLDWAVLRGLNIRTGEASPLLEAIAGTNVRIAGYMVPLDDGFQEVSDFLLVATAGACVHTPPPPGNQIVYAQLASGRPVKVELIYSIWAYGKLELTSTESSYGPAGFRMSVVDIRRRG